MRAGGGRGLDGRERTAALIRGAVRAGGRTGFRLWRFRGIARKHPPMLARLLLPAILLLLSLSSPGWAQASAPDFVGGYRLQGGPDVASELILRADGTYAYWLMAGALDEASEGRWTLADGRLSLVTEPRPVPPEFRQAEFSPEGSALRLEVNWPNGRGIAGIDFRIGLADGHVLEAYTQHDGWEAAGQLADEPQWIELEEPVHNILSGRIALPPHARTLRFILLPNDLGRVDLTGATIEADGKELTLRRQEGAMVFVRAFSVPFRER